jgi:hypothetical protein
MICFIQHLQFREVWGSHDKDTDCGLLGFDASRFLSTILSNISLQPWSDTFLRNNGDYPEVYTVTIQTTVYKYDDDL